MAKKIDIGNGFEIEFIQRAKGQESPYWIGNIYQDNKIVTSFSNNGCGGPTQIRNQQIKNQFEKIAVDELIKQGISEEKANSRYLESYQFLINFAEEKGYNRAFVNSSFQEYIKMIIPQYKQYGLL